MVFGAGSDVYGAVASLDCWGRLIGSSGVGHAFCRGVDGSGVNIGGVGYIGYGDANSVSVFVTRVLQQAEKERKSPIALRWAST